MPEFFSSHVPRSFLSHVLVWIFLGTVGIQAGTSGKIAGRIFDQSNGDPLPYAQVMVTGQIIGGSEIALSSPMGTTSDGDGRYFIINISPGVWKLEVSFMGYGKQVKKPIRVEVDRTTTVDFAMQEETIQGDEIIVVADRSLVVKDLTSSSSKVSGDDIKALPVESFAEVLELKAGVTTGMGGELHIRGGRASEIQYYVDGIAISNPFSNSLAVPVENNAIQELEVISGTFNAEYGQAMSGIVNIVTRDGTEKFQGSFSTYFGDFFSSRDEIFAHIDQISPLSQKYFEGSLSGPVFSKKLSFFASGKISDRENWLYGRRVFLPSDSSAFISPNPDEYYIERHGDSAWVPMNPGKSYSGQIKLTYRPVGSLKFSYNLMLNRAESQSYSNFYQLNPDYRPTGYSHSSNHLFKFEHSLNPAMFYNVNIAYYENDYKSYVYENPQDARYGSIFGRGNQPQFVFSTGSVDPSHYYQNSKTLALRSDFNWQFNNNHLLKLGLESRFHTLEMEYFSLDVDPFRYSDLTPVVPPLTSIDHNQYTKKPMELAAYFQDKIEIQDLIVNVGIRLDYFKPNSDIPTDFRDPANKLRPRDVDSAYTDVDSKVQLSPRLGLAFPITDRGVFHASYGQFFQIPEFSRLYENPEFEVAGNLGSFIGNADLKAQRTDMYEIGLQQQLTNFLAVDVTMFYRNIRNLLSSELHITYQNDIIYGRYVNNDHGNVRGVTLATKIRLAETGISGGVDYTYQVAKGIASDPKQKLWDAQGRSESSILLNPLSWDLRHSANGYVNYSQTGWGGSLIARLNSGYPFTPAGYPELPNAGRLKGDFFMDFQMYKRFQIDRWGMELFIRIENLLDNYRNYLLPEVDPRDELAQQQNGLDQINTRYEYELNPGAQPKPREIKLGIKVDF